MISRRKTARALAGLSRRVPVGIDLLIAISGIENERDRSEALVRGALIEDALERAIINRMRGLDAADKQRLFGPIAPLSSFSAQIAIAYAIKIIGPQTRDDLDCIREIRNAFAHTISRIEFTTPEVAAHCAHLQLPARFPPGWGPHDLPWPPTASEPRRLFLATTTLLWTYLMDAAMEIPRLQDEAYFLT
jgi:hypothetical protein